MSAVVLRTAGSWCPLASPPGTAVSASRRPVSRRHIPPDGACPGPGPHGARSGGGSSRAAETSGRRRSEATSSRWLRCCSRRLALVIAASASTGAIMPAAATVSMAFALNSGARHSLLPPLRTGPLTTPQASRHATDRIVAPPCRALDAGLRPGPFPGQAASLLPGLLAATRTGLPPAGDDELTNTKIHHGITSRCHLLLCWAHE
jgi:hypothetical protein